MMAAFSIWGVRNPVPRTGNRCEEQTSQSNVHTGFEVSRGPVANVWYNGNKGRGHLGASEQPGSRSRSRAGQHEGSPTDPPQTQWGAWGRGVGGLRTSCTGTAGAKWGGTHRARPSGRAQGSQATTLRHRSGPGGVDGGPACHPTQGGVHKGHAEKKIGTPRNVCLPIRAGERPLCLEVG